MDLPVHATASPTDPFPTCWAAVRESTNPVIDVHNNPNQTGNDQYVPAPVKMGNGDIWVYVKDSVSIFAWKSTDGGVTFALQNSNNAVLTKGTAGAFDDLAVKEQHVVYDSANSTLHMFYGGQHSADNKWSVGHATAADSDPATWTKDAGNPILAHAAVATQIGATSVTDLKLCDAIVISGTYHFYGYLQHDGTNSLWHCTGTALASPDVSTLTLIFTPSGVWTDVSWPSVFIYGSLYGMLYSLGAPQTGSEPLAKWRAVWPAVSTDGAAWSFNGGTVLAPLTGWESLEAYAAQLLKESVTPFANPVADANGRWHLYYSGWDGTFASSGLLYMAPS